MTTGIGAKTLIGFRWQKSFAGNGERRELLISGVHPTQLINLEYLGSQLNCRKLVCATYSLPKSQRLIFFYLGYTAELQHCSINFLPIVRVPAELTEKGKKKDKTLPCSGLDNPPSYSLG